MTRCDGKLADVRRESRTESPSTMQSPDWGLPVEEILRSLQEGRRVEEFRGFLRGIVTFVAREPDRL